MENAGKARLGLVQMSCVADPVANLEKAVGFILEAAEKGADLICLQELFNTLYFCQEEDFERFSLAQSIPGPATERLGQIAKDKKLTIVAPLFERAAPGVFFNSAAIIHPDGKVAGVYRKMHIPDDPQFYEKFYFTPGDGGFKSWEIPAGRIGVCICWDQWFPEAARMTALQGANALFYPTAIGWLPSDKEKGLGPAQHNAWETIQRSHAIANGCFVVAVNRVGLEQDASGEGIEFWGQSFVANPAGEIIAKASVSDEEVLIVDVDFGDIEKQRVMWPFFRDRRIDAYQGLTKRWGGSAE